MPRAQNEDSYLHNKQDKQNILLKKPQKTINKLAFWKLRAELQGKSTQRWEGSLLPIHY